MTSNSTILELCTSPNKGGLELYFADISNQIALSFNTIRVLGAHSSLHDFLNQSIPTFIVKKSSHYLPLKAARKLAKIIDEEKVELIHLHWNKDLALAVFAKVFSKSKPKIVLTRQMQFPGKKNSFYHRFIYKQVDHIIAITKTLENDLRKNIPLDVQPGISTIYYGVKPVDKADKLSIDALRAQYIDTNDDFLIGLFGRIDPQKGQDLVIEALKLAQKSAIPFKVLFVGTPMSQDYVDKLKERIETYGLEKTIIFTGFINQPKALMQACDCIALTTIEETFGLVLIEAMSLGIPVIGSNRGGVPEIIENEKSGLLFESQNPQSLLNAFTKLYNDPSAAQEYRDNALIKVQETFNYHKHEEKIIALFNKLLKDTHE